MNFEEYRKQLEELSLESGSCPLRAMTDEEKNKLLCEQYKQKLFQQHEKEYEGCYFSALYLPF